jgi:hypothetical protein
MQGRQQLSSLSARLQLFGSSWFCCVACLIAWFGGCWASVVLFVISIGCHHTWQCCAVQDNLALQDTAGSSCIWQRQCRMIWRLAMLGSAGQAALKQCAL